jgi:hypothetical protein
MPVTTVYPEEFAELFFDLVFEKRRDSSCRDKVQENGESQEMRQDRRETHVRRSLNDWKLLESESGAGKEVGLDPEDDVQAWSGERVGS